MISEPSFIPYNTSYMSEVRGVHPLSSSPASSAFFNTPSMNSPPQSSNTINNNGILNEEVTTIFVVGFPEDMQEREFQNMFMFSPGFEAASLKWHCKDQDDDSATTINPTLNGKKQMIGFARFRTRLEALEAVDVISGKKVDQEKGFTLKAEMAKKNLHVKRGSIAPIPTTTDTTPTSQSPFEPLSLNNNSNSNSIVNNSNSNTINNSTSTTTTTSTTINNNNNNTKLMFGYHEPFAFSPLPSDLLSPMTDYKSDPFALAAEHQQSSMTPTTPVFNDNIFGFRSYSIDGRNSNPTNNNNTNNMNQLGIAPRASVSSITAFTQRLSIKQPHPTTTIPEDISLDPFNYLSKSSPMPIERVNQHPYFMDENNNNTTNLADQNPPCNTLYVGNLPPNTNEDELRQLFSKCNGYKRMYFRTKPQGPMCFVEFENVMYASQTMTDLQGQTLSNSIKGGIRLSFSKNPLFTKPNKTSNDQQQQNTQRTVLTAQLNNEPQL